MKKIVTLFASLFIIAIAAQNVNAQSPNPTVSDNGMASATIIKVLSISAEDDLLFGNIVASAAGGTVTISPDGTPSYSTGIAAPLANPGTRQNATFSVTGETGLTYNIGLPESIELKSGQDVMTVDSFASDPKNNEGVLTDGTQTVKVGATLNVAANQATGVYSGSFPVTVSYN